MKTIYIKPITDIISTDIDKHVLFNHSEPEITSNIGSNENKIFEDYEEDVKDNLWDEIK